MSGDRFAWARFNADTLFLGLLAAGAGTFDLIDPYRDAVVGARDAVLPLFYLRAGGYLLSGVVLVAALATESIRAEVIARSILIGAVILNVYRHATWLGLGNTATQATIVLLAIVGVTCYLRFSVLTGRRGLRIERSAAPNAGGE